MHPVHPPFLRAWNVCSIFYEPLLNSLEVDESALKKQNKAYKQLSQRIERHKQLTIVEEKIKFRRDISNKNNKPTVVLKEESASNPAIVRWKVERKR